MDGGDPAGGSRQLALLIDRYGEFLLPDLKHYYGLDLRDLLSEDRPLSPRFVLAHVTNLPYDSALVAEFRGGQQFRGWDKDRYMTATLIDAIRLLQYIFVLANSDPKKTKPKPPAPYPLPDGQVEAKKPDTPGSFAFIAKANLAAIKKRKAQG